MTNLRLAVTGGEGYIGSALIPKLLENPKVASILSIDKRSEQNVKVVEAVRIDLATVSAKDLAEALQDVDVLFHLAAARVDWGLSREGYARDNVLVTKTLIEAAEIVGIKKWIYFGTVGVYGSSDIPLDEDAPFNPQSDYATTKAEAELALMEAAKALSWDVITIRPSAVFSEHQPSNTNLYRLIEAIRKNRFFLVGGGGEIKTTSYLHNLVDATVWVFNNGDFNGIKALNYVDTPCKSTLMLVKVIREKLNCRFPLVRIPRFIVEKPAAFIDWIGNLLKIDFPISAARVRKFCTSTNYSAERIHALGFKPKYSYDEAIHRTVAWHRSRADVGDCRKSKSVVPRKP